MSKQTKSLKYFEVRWYSKATGVWLGETRVLAEQYNYDLEAFKEEIYDALAYTTSEDQLDIQIMEVYTDGTATKR